MAAIEEAVTGLETVITEDLPAILASLESSYADGIRLEPIRTVEWEETLQDAVQTTPCVLIVGSNEMDVSLRDQTRTCHIIMVFILESHDKKTLTKMMYRYARALRMVLRVSDATNGLNRTLRQRVISAKVMEVDYGPTFTDAQLFTRAFQARIEVRVFQEND